MIKKIGSSAAYVTGMSRSAIYHFETGKVYSINAEGTGILSAYFSGKGLTEEQRGFLAQVCSGTGLRLDCFCDYEFPKFEPALDFVWLELTQNCNYRCVHCYQGTSHEDRKEKLSLDEWKSIILQCIDAGCRHIQFIGGEPTLSRDLPELLRFSHDVGIDRIVLFSNLSHMNGELLSAIADCGVFVNFSIYGASAPIHDHITQVSGSFERLISSIKQLKELHVSLRANMTIMKENEAEREAVRAFLNSLGINSIHYDEIRKVYGGEQDPHMPSNPTLQLKEPNFRTDIVSFERSWSTNTCWCGKLSISTDGSIFPCEFERNITYGNVRHTPIADVLKSEAVKKYWHFSFENITPCKYCEYRFACKDCRPMAYGEYGSITAQSPRCCYNPLSGQWITKRQPVCT